MLKEFLKKLENNDARSFWNLVKEFQKDKIKLMNLILADELNNYTDLFKHHIIGIPHKEELEISLLGKAILQMSSHFGYIVDCDNNMDLYSDIKSILTNMSLSRYVFWDCDDEKHQFKLLGIWPGDEVRKLSSKYDIHINATGSLVIKLTVNANSSESLFEQLLSFSNEKWLIYFKLLTSDIYYSGVMPCVKEIVYEENPHLSGKIDYLVFNVVRTTYATVDTFDNSQILIHTFFHSKNSKKYYDYLVEFDRHEDEVQEKHLYSEPATQKNYESDNVKQLNDYLKYSLNTHTIAVSANLITSDRYLIAAKRGSLNIDSGEFYCSTNGQTEFRDENVSFYRKSVFEDMPTMDYFSKYRVDMTNEIQRECIAELGITSFNLDWNCYGVSYLSINNASNSETAKFRRMHFNVLMSNSLSHSFKEVDKFHKYATESFENESIVGIKIKIFNDKRDVLKSLFLILYNWLEENKSRIFLFLIIMSILLEK